MSGPREVLMSGLLGLRSRAAQNPTLRRLVYEARNRMLFGDLFQHDRMLADRVRLDAYQAALARHIHAGDVVADLGTGSGVLALLAARQGARTVHAIEHGPLIDAAREVAREAGFSNIVFHRMNSRSFVCDEPVDAIIHEQLGDAAFDELVVANVADLRDRVLGPGGRILPRLIDMYIEPVQLRDDYRFPYAWTAEIDGISFRPLKSLRDRQHESYRYRTMWPFPFGFYLGDPEPVLRVDLMTATLDSLPHRINASRSVVRPGHLDGFCVFFRAWFDDEISFSTAPDGPGTSWGTPLLRVEPRRAERGDVIVLELDADDLAVPTTWRWPDDTPIQRAAKTR